MPNSEYVYKAATADELDARWERLIAENAGDGRWAAWRDEYIADNLAGKCRTFVVLHGNWPVGEGTVLFSPECGAICGRTVLADGKSVANINALRIDKAHEGKGHISKLVRLMEQCTADAGCKTVTIGVEAKETRNLAIYLHWGYRTFVMSEIEDGSLVLYYSKALG